GMVRPFSASVSSWKANSWEMPSVPLNPARSSASSPSGVWTRNTRSACTKPAIAVSPYTRSGKGDPLSREPWRALGALAKARGSTDKGGIRIRGGVGPPKSPRAWARGLGETTVGGRRFREEVRAQEGRGRTHDRGDHLLLREAGLLDQAAPEVPLGGPRRPAQEGDVILRDLAVAVLGRGQDLDRDLRPHRQRLAGRGAVQPVQ